MARDWELIGSVWQSRDARNGQRRVKVIEVKNGMAICENVSGGQKAQSKIAVAYLHERWDRVVG